LRIWVFTMFRETHNSRAISGAVRLVGSSAAGEARFRWAPRASAAAWPGRGAGSREQALDVGEQGRVRGRVPDVAGEQARRWIEQERCHLAVGLSHVQYGRTVQDRGERGRGPGVVLWQSKRRRSDADLGVLALRVAELGQELPGGPGLAEPHEALQHKCPYLGDDGVLRKLTVLRLVVLRSLYHPDMRKPQLTALRRYAFRRSRCG
jgi:hypothetical protein